MLTQKVVVLRKDVLKDILEKDLKIVFIGSAASNISASEGHYYANPRNNFWRLLHEARLTDRKLLPNEDSALITYCYGLTDVVKSEHGNDSSLTKESLTKDRMQLEAKIRKFHPLVVCFTSKNALRLFLGHTAKSYGLQPTTSGLPSYMFVVPSPSPQVMSNRRLNGKTRLEWFKELAKFVKESARCNTC